MALEQEHFEGLEAAIVEETDEAGAPGTRVEVELGASEARRGREAVERAALHYPVPVTLDGRAVRQRPYLEEAAEVTEWKGLRIGIRTDTYGGHRRGINFHGIVVDLDDERPVTPVRNGRDRGLSYWGMVDVVRCPELKLVLPARRAVVRNTFAAELGRKVRELTLRAVAAAEPNATLRYADWAEGRRLGIAMPAGEARLAGFRPTDAA